MIQMSVNSLFCAVIIMWASRRTFMTNNFILRLLYGIVALAALAIIVGPTYGYHSPARPEVTLNGALALLFLYLMNRERMRSIWQWLRGRFIRYRSHCHFPSGK